MLYFSCLHSASSQVRCFHYNRSTELLKTTDCTGTCLGCLSLCLYVCVCVTVCACNVKTPDEEISLIEPTKSNSYAIVQSKETEF